MLIKELEGGTKVKSYSQLIGIRKKKHEFKHVYRLNLLKHKLLKRYIKSKKNEFYLFILYKGNRDLSLHVSLGEEVKFKGFVYKDKEMQNVHCLFNNRHFDFDLNNCPSLSKFYVQL